MRGVLESVQHLTGVGVWSYDVTTDEAWWSDQTKRLHDVDADEDPSFGALLGRYAEADQSRVMEMFAAALEAGEPFEAVAAINDETFAETLATRMDEYMLAAGRGPDE